MSQLFSIQDDKIIINKLDLANLSGDVIHTGTLTLNGTQTVTGNVSINGSIRVEKKLVVDVIEANQIINNNLTNNGDNGSTKFIGNTENDLNGQGIVWGTLNTENQLAYRTGGRLWTDMTFDLAPGKSYQINNLDVLTANTLGSTIIRSSLRQLGPLNNLTVVGSSNLGDVVVVDSDTSRVGINTESPNATFSVVDENVEIVLGCKNGAAAIGAFSKTDLILVTDNTPRVTIRNGEVHIGNKNQVATDLFVHGTLYADNVITSQQTSNTLVFGSLETGFTWKTSGNDKHLFMNDSSLWTTENFNLISDKTFQINNQVVLSATALGDTVISSSLTSVGVLTGLNVSGAANLSTITAESIDTVVLKVDSFTVATITSDSLTITAGGSNALRVDSDFINIGSVETSKRNVRVFGNVSVNVNQPDSDLDLEVAGNIGFAGRKFISGNSSPQYGSFKQGDTCWNTQPNIGSYMGWVCIASGTPGQWAPFGLIG
jgi:hypothetical protein